KTETADAPPPAPETEAPEVAPAAEEAPAPAPEAEPAAPPPPPPPPVARTYTVVSGDTLWAISERFYGDGSKYQGIADASGVSNPDLIHARQVLTIPYVQRRGRPGRKVRAITVLHRCPAALGLPHGAPARRRV